MKWSCAYTSLMEIITEAFSPLYPRAFIIVINSLDSPDNMLTNNALYPWGTSAGEDKHSLSIGSAKFKHERNAIIQHQPCHGAMRQSSNYIRPASCRTSSDVGEHQCALMHAYSCAIEMQEVMSTLRLYRYWSFIGIGTNISSIGIELFGSEWGQCRIIYSRRCSRVL